MRPWIYTAIVLSMVAFSAVGADVTPDRVTPESQEREDRPWEQWQLSRSEWERFESLMRGPRGNWTPDISPVMALGIHARSEQERQRYVELSVELNTERLKAEGAWHSTLMDEVRKTADAHRVDLQTQASAPDGQSLSPDDIGSGDTLVLFVSSECPEACRAAIDLAMERGSTLDIFFVGGLGSEDVRRWAREQQLDPKAVNDTRQITLNVDDGFYNQVSVDETPPQLYIRERGNPEELAEVVLW